MTTPTRISWSCAALVLAIGCGHTDSAPPEPEPRATEESVPEPTEAAEPAPAPAPTPDPAPTPTGQLRTELRDVLDVVESPTSVRMAELRVIGALQAEEHRLDTDRMGGYPIVGTPVDVPLADVPALVATLLDDASYDFEIERRCANRFFTGVTFEREGRRVDFLLGTPCDQALWFHRGTAGAVSSGGYMLSGPVGTVHALAGRLGIRTPR